MLQKNQIDLTIFVCVSQASESTILESGRRFSNGSKILVSKIVLLRRWDSVKHEKFVLSCKRTDKGRIATLKGLEADSFSTANPSLGGISNSL